jgi:hypothetical protein
MTSYLFDSLDLCKDRDAAIKFALDCILRDRGFTALAEFIADFIAHETKFIGFLGGDGGWAIEYKEQNLTEDLVWPEGADFCASVDPRDCGLAYPEYFMTKDEFYVYVRKALRAFVERHPDEAALVEPVLAIMAATSGQTPA